jgi:hypothetical protein
MPSRVTPSTPDQLVFTNSSRCLPRVDHGGNIVCRCPAGLIVLANFSRNAVSYNDTEAKMLLTRTLIVPAILGLIGISSPSWAECRCQINRLEFGLGLNVLRKPNTLVGTLQNGANVTRVSMRDGWSWVEWRNGNSVRTGYVLGQYVLCPDYCPSRHGFGPPDVPFPLGK